MSTGHTQFKPNDSLSISLSLSMSLSLSLSLFLYLTILIKRSKELFSGIELSYYNLPIFDQIFQKLNEKWHIFN